MTPAERRTCVAALEAAERAAEALRAVLSHEAAEAAEAERPVAALSLKQVAHDYGVSECTARRWAHDRGFKRGGRWFVEPSQIETRPQVMRG